MAGAVVTRVVVFDQSLYRATGDVGKWCRLITRHFTQHAIEKAPERSGQLRAGISGDSHQIGPRQVQGVIESSAPHTMFVLRGTSSPIMTNAHWDNPSGRGKGHWLRVGAGNGYNEFYALSVSGQQANNFLEKAWRETARNHRAIRGGVPGFIRNI